MYSIVFGLLFVVTVTLAQDSPRFRHIRETYGLENGTEVGETRLVGTPSLTTLAKDRYKWIVTIYDPATVASATDKDKGYGPGVVVNTYFVVAHSALHSLVSDKTTLRIAGLTTTGNPTPSENPFYTKVKQQIAYSSPVTPIDTIQLFRVCPPFASANVYTIPNTAPSTVPNVVFSYINYVPELKSGTKKIGEDCECDTYTPNYQTVIIASTFCAEASVDNMIEATDKVGTVAVYDNSGTDVFLGFNIDMAHGELFLDLHSTASGHDYLTWIHDNSVYPPV